MNMDEKRQNELKELQKLASMDDTQKFRFEELNALDTAEKTAAQKIKDLESALAQKDHFRTKFEKEEADRKSLEKKIAEGNGQSKGLNVEDYIDISASLEGLDQKEKERLAREHKLTGRPIAEIRKDEDYTLWQSAYRAKVEKEKQTLKPNSTQPDADRPVSLQEALAGAKTIQEKAELLEAAGLYQENRPRSDRTKIVK